MASTSSTGITSPAAAGTQSVQNPNCEWQQKCSSFAEMGRFLLEKPHLSDVVLRCGITETWDLPAQKLILAGSSSVFEEILFGSKKSTDPMPIIRVEAEKPVVEVLLKLIYGLDQSGLLTMANAFQVLHASEKYKVHIAMGLCETWIKENMNATNCLSWLMTAEESQTTSSQMAVREHCWQYIDESAAQVFSCAKFLEIDRSLVFNILKRSSLRVNELAVYRAAVKWASGACRLENRTDNRDNKRAVLGNALYQIRFTLMSATEFLDGPAKRLLLSSNEVNAIMLHIVTNKRPALQFVTEPRAFIVPNGIFKVDRFASTYGKRTYFYDSAIDSVRFCVDRDITLVGCEIYTSGKDRYSVDVKVFEGADEDPVHQEVVKVPPVSSRIIMGPACVAQVKFNKELPIRCLTQCIIQCKITGKESDFGITGKDQATAKVTLDNGNSIQYCFSFSLVPASGTCVRSSTSSGQIPTILFRP